MPDIPQVHVIVDGRPVSVNALFHLPYGKGPEAKERRLIWEKRIIKMFKDLGPFCRIAKDVWGFWRSGPYTMEVKANYSLHMKAVKEQSTKAYRVKKMGEFLIFMSEPPS